MSDDLKKTVEEALGEGFLFRMGENSYSEGRFDPEDFISTGSRVLNYKLTGNSKCGFRKGRIVEIYGQEGCGKTTLALHACAEANLNGIDVVYLDVEHALDFKYAKSIGVDPKLFLISQPDCGEDALSVMINILRNIKKPALFVIDSVANFVPRAEIEGDADDQGIGQHARLIGKVMRKTTSLFSKTKSPAIFINQIRMKIGSYGNPEVPTGGNALKFYATQRIEIRAPRKGKLLEGPKNSRGKLGDEVDDEKQDGKTEIGKEVNFKIIKNKIYPPYKEGTVNLLYGKGIDKQDDLLRFFETLGIISFYGKKIVYHKKNMLRSKFIDRLKEKEFKNRIKKEIREKEEE